MERKDLERMMLAGAPRKQQSREDALIEALDMKEVLVKHADWIEKIRDGRVDVGQFLMSVAPDVAVQLFAKAVTPGKDQMDAIKDLLDRAGHGKVNKHAIAAVDPSQPKEQLMAMLLGLNKKSGLIDIEEDDDSKSGK